MNLIRGPLGITHQLAGAGLYLTKDGLFVYINRLGVVLATYPLNATLETLSNAAAKIVERMVKE